MNEERDVITQLISTVTTLIAHVHAINRLLIAKGISTDEEICQMQDQTEIDLGGD